MKTTTPKPTWTWRLLVLLASICFMVSPMWAAERRPNVVFVLGDDQAWWDYGFMRKAGAEAAAISSNSAIYPVAHTPAIDRLADEGLVFTHGYVPTSLCRPSLMSIITGTYPHQHRVTGNDLANSAPDQEFDERVLHMQSLPRILGKRLDYKSFQTGKWWQGHYSSGGFTEGDTVNSTSISLKPKAWNSTSRPSYVQARHGDWGLMIGRVDYVNGVAAPPHPIPYANTVVPVTEFIDARVAAGEPFFVWYAPFLPHTPHDPPAGLLDFYDDLIVEPNETGDYFAKYYANIERLDGGIGAILDHLDAVGIASNTMVVLLCDNGWINQENASAYAPKSKRSPYDGGLRTPMIIRWPDRIKPGGAIEPQIVTTPVSAIDLVPTVLRAVGLEPSPEMRGIDLLDARAVAARDTVFGDVYEHDALSVDDPTLSLRYLWARRGGWKLILSRNGLGSAELYHLYDETTGAPVDPFETNDLSAVEPARVTGLTDAIEAWYGEAKDLGWTSAASQTLASALLPAEEMIGQTWTASREELLTAIRLVLKPAAGSQFFTVEVRELDVEGAPRGSLLGSATLPPEVFIPGEIRRYLFPLRKPLRLSPDQALGFRGFGGPNPGGFEVGYVNTNAYANGRMCFEGLIEGQAWPAADFDLAFEILASNYDLPSKLQIGADGNLARLQGFLEMKGIPVVLRSSQDLTNWIAKAGDDNRDGLAAWHLPMAQPREFFRVDPVATGDLVSLVPSNLAGVIFLDDFSGDGMAALHGTMPDITTGGASWQASTIFKNNGTILPASAGGAAYLPFSPAPGNIYTLAGDLKVGEIDNNNWIALGFVQNIATLTGDAARHANAPDGIAWILHRKSATNLDQVFRPGPGTADPPGILWSAELNVTNLTVEIVLDARDANNVLLSLNVNGAEPEVTTANIGPLASLNINGVGFSFDSGGSGSFDNFQLSVNPPGGG